MKRKGNGWGGENGGGNDEEGITPPTFNLRQNHNIRPEQLQQEPWEGLLSPEQRERLLKSPSVCILYKGFHSDGRISVVTVTLTQCFTQSNCHMSEDLSSGKAEHLPSNPILTGTYNPI